MKESVGGHQIILCYAAQQQERYETVSVKPFSLEPDRVRLLDGRGGCVTQWLYVARARRDDGTQP